MGAGASAAISASSDTSTPNILELLQKNQSKIADAARQDPDSFEKLVQAIRVEASSNAVTNSTTTSPPPTNTQPASGSPSPEVQVVHEINLCRTNPSLYATKLKETIPFYQGKKVVRPNETTLLTSEGVTAVEECIAELEKTPPMQALQLPMEEGLCHACKDHNEDTGPKGMTGHDGSDGSKPADRMSKYGLWTGGCAENISYGHNDPFRIVAQLLVDDGVPSRGHRKNILTPTFAKVGISIGPHTKYKYMCTQNFANDYRSGMPSFDRSKNFVIKDATQMTSNISNFLSIVPFEQITNKIKEALSVSDGSNKVTIKYTAPGQLEVQISHNGGGSQSFTCNF
jgi:uncharacterized protein YkwD